MLKRMQQIACDNNICVLATAKNNKPHCSLMAYVTDDHCREIYMVTHRSSQKYRNLTVNRSVSLLIDTRGLGPREKTQALTVSGRFAPIVDIPEKKIAMSRLIGSHPHLERLLTNPEAEILRVKIESFLLLDGPENAYYEVL